MNISSEQRKIANWLQGAHDGDTPNPDRLPRTLAAQTYENDPAVKQQRIKKGIPVIVSCIAGIAMLCAGFSPYFLEITLSLPWKIVSGAAAILGALLLVGSLFATDMQEPLPDITDDEKRVLETKIHEYNAAVANDETELAEKIFRALVSELDSMYDFKVYTMQEILRGATADVDMDGLRRRYQEA